MESSLFDPNNHVPEATQDDVWGDPVGLQAASNGVVTVLPPKRSKLENQAPSSGKEIEGIRIGETSGRLPAEETEGRLEVQEIDGTVVRLAPEEPSAPKVPRQIKFLERPVKAPVDPYRRGESKDWGFARKQSIRWIVGTGVGVISLVVFSMMLLPMINQSNAARPAENALVLDTADEIKGAEALNAMLSRQPEAEQVFRKFAAASIARDVLPLLRDVDQVQPLVLQGDWKPLVSRDWVPSDDTTWSVFDMDGSPYGVLEGTLPDFSTFSAYFLLSENHLQLDWKATTRHGTASMTELARGQGNPAEIRAKISPCGYFTAAYPEADYQSYQFVSSDDETSIWCYTRKGGEADHALAKLFQNGAILQSSLEPRKVTLRLERGGADSFPNQWLVSEVLGDDWIIP